MLKLKAGDKVKMERYIASKLVLKKGDSGEAVQVLQRALGSQGYFKYFNGGNFGELTRSAVFWFQASHIGSNGIFLDADCEIGPNSWWALLNPSGDPQAQDIPAIIPSGLSSDRVAILEAAIKEFEKGVHEVPDGSNWGSEIKKYGGRKGWAWCMLYCNWVSKQALGVYPTKKGNSASTYQTWQQAIKEDKFIDKNRRPLPGDLMMMQYKNSAGQYKHKGHVGIVLRVEGGRNGGLINCVEGNTKNKVDVTIRDMKNSKIVGWIDVCGGSRNLRYEKGVMYGKVASDNFSSTR